jgi:hypothetical protein
MKMAVTGATFPSTLGAQTVLEMSLHMGSAWKLLVAYIVVSWTVFEVLPEGLTSVLWYSKMKFSFRLYWKSNLLILPSVVLYKK